MATYRVWRWQEDGRWHAEVDKMFALSASAPDEVEQMVRDRISAVTKDPKIALDVVHTTGDVRRLERVGATSPVLDRAVLRELIAASKLAHIEDSLLDGTQPAVRIRAHRITQDLTVPLGLSRFGGDPDLPSGMPWPSSHGRPLAMLAQINLSEVPTAPTEPLGLGLPSVGMMWFWYDAIESPWDSEPNDPESGFRVIYSPQPQSLVRVATPRELAGSAQWNTACNLVFSRILSLPWPDLSYDSGELSRFFELRDIVEGGAGYAHHQLRGNYDVCNDSTPDEHPGAVLLAQLDSDEQGPGWSWGDAGAMHFWIHPDDFREHQFHRAWGVIDTT